MIGTLNNEQVDQVLRENIVGRIGCADGEKIMVVPVNYVFDGKSIIGHSLPGTKITMMRRNPRVCFEVDEIKSPDQWKSVMLWGEYQELNDERDRYYAMKQFVDRMIHLKISESAIPPEKEEQRVHPRANGNVRPVIYRIVITEKSGRFEH